MTSVEKRHSGRRGGVHRKHSDGGYSDTSSGGSFLDETDREVSNLTDRAFRSLCVGDEAVYNDSDLCPFSPATKRERQLAFSHSDQDWDKEDSEREAIKKAAHDTFSLRVQQYGQDWIQGGQYGLESQADPQFGNYGEGRTEGNVSATFESSFVDMSRQERSVREEHLSFHSNGAMELGTQQRRSRSRVSSLIKAFDSDGYRDGGGLDGHLRDWNSETSWDKSALMSIQRELSEFSTAYHQSFNSGGFLSADPFSSRDNSLYSSEVAAAMGHMDSSSSFMRSHDNTHSMSMQLDSNSNFFMHSKLSPFRVWRDHNRFPFRQGEVSGYVPHSEFPKWYETPMYKELSLGLPSQGPFMYEERGFRPHRKALESVAPPPPPRSTSTSMVLQRASALEKRCESELAGHNPPWKRAQSLGANRLPSQRPSTVSPTIEMSRHVRDTLTSITDLKQKITMTTEQSITTEMMARQEGALHSNDSLTPFSNKVTTVTVEQNVVSNNTSTTPFNISQLLTPVIHNTQQETGTSEVQLYSISPPMVEHAPVRAESRGSTPDVRMSSYKSRATSLLFNLKDNRKRVKSTYSPTKFKGLETIDKNKRASNQDSNEPPRDTVIDIPEFPDTLVPQVTVHKEPSIVDATSHPYLQGHHSPSLPLTAYTSQPTTAHIGQNTEYNSGDYLTPQMQGEMAYRPGFSGSAQGNYTSKDQLANGQSIQRELSPFTQFRLGEIGKTETLTGDVYRQASSNKPGVSNTLATAISTLPKPNLSPRPSYSTTDTPRVNVDSTNQNREYLTAKDTTEQNPYESTGMGYTKANRYEQVTENKYGYSHVSSQDSWRQQAFVNNTSSRETETLSPNDRLQPVRPPWKGEIAALIERDKLAQSSQRAAMMKHDIYSPRDKYGGDKEQEKADLRQSLAEDTSSLPHPYHTVADHNLSNQLQHYAPHNADTVPKGKQQPGTLTDTYKFQKHYGLNEEHQIQERSLAQNCHLYGSTEQEYRKQQLFYHDGDKNGMLTQQEPVQRKDGPLLEENQLLRYQQNEFKQHYDHSMQRNTLASTEDQQYKENGHTTTNQIKDRHVEAKADQARTEQIKAEQAREEQARAEQAEKDREEKENRAREEQAKAERARTETLKAERAKSEQIKAEQAKAEQAKRKQAEWARAEKAEAERIKTEQIRAERIKAEQAEAAQIKAEQAEAERIKTEQIRVERIKAEQAEADIIKAEAVRIKVEQIRAERIKAEQDEAERIKAEQAEVERIKAEQAEAERIKAEQAEAEIIKAEQVEAERIKTEQIRAEIIRAEQAEADRTKAEQNEVEQIEAGRLKAEQAKAEEQIKAEKAKIEQARVERMKVEQAKAELAKIEKVKAQSAKSKAKQAVTEQVKVEPAKVEQVKTELAKAKAELAKIKEKMRGEQKDKVRYSLTGKEGDIANQDVSVKVKCTKNEESKEQGQTTQKYQQSEYSMVSRYDRGIAERGPDDYDCVREKYGFSSAISTDESKVSLQDDSKSSAFATDKGEEAVSNKKSNNESYLINRIATAKTEKDKNVSIKYDEVKENRYVYSETLKEFKLSSANDLPTNDGKTTNSETFGNKEKDDRGMNDNSEKYDPLKHRLDDPSALKTKNHNHQFEILAPKDAAKPFALERKPKSTEHSVSSSKDMHSSPFKALSYKERAQTKQEILTSKIKAHAEKEISAIREKGFAHNPIKHLTIGQSNNIRMKPPSQEVSKRHDTTVSNNITPKQHMGATGTHYTMEPERIESNARSINEKTKQRPKKEDPTGIKSPTKTKELGAMSLREQEGKHGDNSGKLKEGIKSKAATIIDLVNEKKEVDPSHNRALVNKGEAAVVKMNKVEETQTPSKAESENEAMSEGSTPSVKLFLGQSESIVEDDNLQIMGIRVSVRERKPSESNEQVDSVQEETDIHKYHPGSGFEGSKVNYASGVNNPHPENVQATSNIDTVRNKTPVIKEKRTTTKEKSSSSNGRSQRETLPQNSLTNKGEPSTVIESAKNKMSAETQPLLFKQGMITRKAKDYTSKNLNENSAKSSIEDVIEQDLQPPMREDMAKYDISSKNSNRDGESAPLLVERRQDTASREENLHNKNGAPLNSLAGNESRHLAAVSKQYTEPHSAENSQAEEDVHIDGVAIRIVPGIIEQDSHTITENHPTIKSPQNSLTAINENKLVPLPSSDGKTNASKDKDRAKLFTPASKELTQIKDSLEPLHMSPIVRQGAHSLRVGDQHNSGDATSENKQVENGKTEKVKGDGDTADEMKSQTMMTDGDYFQLQGAIETSHEQYNANVNDGGVSDVVSQRQERQPLDQSHSTGHTEELGFSGPAVGGEISGLQTEKTSISKDPQLSQEPNSIRNADMNKAVNSGMKDEQVSTQSDCTTERQTNMSAKRDVGQDIHVRKHDSANQSYLLAKERHQAKKLHSSTDYTDQQNVDHKAEEKPRPKEKVSAIPEISAIADYARLKVIASEDKADITQEPPPSKKEDFFPRIGTRHSRRPVFTTETQDPPVKEKMLAKEPEVNANISKEPKALVFSSMDQEHKRTGLFRLGDKERQETMLPDVKASEGVTDTERIHTQHLKQNTKPTLEHLMIPGGKEQNLSAAEPQGVKPEGAQSVYQQRHPPVPASSSASSANSKTRNPSLSQHLDQRVHPIHVERPREHLLSPKPEGIQHMDKMAHPQQRLQHMYDMEERRAVQQEQERRAKQRVEERAAKIEEEMRERQRGEERLAAQRKEEKIAKQREEGRRAEEERKAKQIEDERRAKQREEERKAKLMEEEKIAKQREEEKRAEEEGRLKQIEEEKAARKEEERRAKQREMERIAEEKRRAKQIEDERRARQIEEERAAKIAEERRLKQIEEEKRAKQLEEERRAKQIEEARRAKYIEEKRAAKIAEEKRLKQIEEEQRAKQLEEERRAKQIEEAKRAKDIEEKRAAKIAEEWRLKQIEEERRIKQIEEEKKAKQLEEERGAAQIEEERRAKQTEEKRAAKIAEERRLKQIEAERKERLREERIAAQRKEEERKEHLREEERRAVQKEEERAKQREEEQKAEQLKQIEEEQRAIQKEEERRAAQERIAAQREEEKRAKQREKEKLAAQSEEEKATLREEQRRAAQKMDALQYYAISSTEGERRPRDRPLRSPLPSPRRVDPSGVELAEDWGSHSRPQAPASPAPSLPRSNTSSPALGAKPTMFRVKDNTFRGSSFTKSVKPRFHKSFGEDFRVGSPLEGRGGSERADEEQDRMRRSAGTPVYHDTAIGSHRLTKESLSLQPASSVQALSAPPSEHRPYSRRSMAMDEDDSRSVLSNMSEDVESFATSAAELADLRGLYDYDRPESACSFSSDVGRALGKPPAVPTKSEKALRRAKRLTTRRVKKALTKGAVDSPAPEEKPVCTVSNVSSSPTDLRSSEQPAFASPHFSSPISLAHAPTSPSNVPSPTTETPSSHRSFHATPHITAPVSTPHATAPVTTHHATAPVTTRHATAPVATPHATAPVSTPHHTAPVLLPNAPRTVASVPSSPTHHQANHQAPVTQYRVEPGYTQPYPMTQRKVLQDPGSGQYFVVDIPVQVKTKTFFDPETGKYVQLNVRQSAQSGSLPKPQPPCTQPHLQTQPQPKPQPSSAAQPYVLYQGYQGYPQGYQPVAVSSLPPHRSSSGMSVPSPVPQETLQSGRARQIYGYQENERGHNAHNYSHEQTPYMDTAHDTHKTCDANTAYNTHASYETCADYDGQLGGDSVNENDNPVRSSSQARDIITMSELEDFMEVYDW